MGPIDADLQACLLAMGIDPPAMTMFDSTVLLPDAFLQLTAPSFEYPRDDCPRRCGLSARLHPGESGAVATVGRRHRRLRKVVLVTQGTLSNHDFTELVAPTLAALAEEPDVLVVVTAGGRSSATIPGPIPDNARLADYLPMEWLLPRTTCSSPTAGTAP